MQANVHAMQQNILSKYLLNKYNKNLDKMQANVHAMQQNILSKYLLNKYNNNSSQYTAILATCNF